MSKKTTAVEWLQECLSIHFSNEQKMQFEGLFQQAKEMERQQIIDAYIDGYSAEQHNADSEQYYNETFKTTEK